MRVFAKMRRILLTHKDLFLKIEQMDKRITSQDEKIKQLFDYLKQFIQEKQTPRKKIGFKQQGEQ